MYCAHCGQPLKEGAKFCAQCGNNIQNQKKMVYVAEMESEPYPEIPEIQDKLVNLGTETDWDFSAINHSIQNTQTGVVRNSLFLALVFAVLTLSTMVEFSPLYQAFPITMIAFFLTIVSLIVAYLFRGREKKLNTLISGDNLLDSWEMDPQLHRRFADETYAAMKAKNTAVLFVIGALIFLIFGLFILFMEDGRLFMATIGIGLFGILIAFAYGMPVYYRNKNLRGDGKILIGAKYAYINGFFHNWDYPLSGLSKVKIIKTPYYGLLLNYHYTDRTGPHACEIEIPTPRKKNLKTLVEDLRAMNENG